MRIEWIRLQDVGPFQDETIQFPPGEDPSLADVYLLTGQNGTGKSTILYALAAVVACGRSTLIDPLLLEARMRSPRAQVVLGTDDRRQVVAALYEHQRNDDLAHLFDGQRPTRINPHSGAVQYFAEPDLHPPYPSQAFRVSLSRDAGVDGHVFDWAAFAYAGARSVRDVQISAVQEPASGPLANSLSFQQTVDTNLLAHWIVSQNYRRLKAKEAGELAEAEQLAQSVRRIEEVIADLVGDPTFGFVTSARDNDVRVRWRGVTVRLGVLPDGLQSIVSWIADLLMRLDRLPWRDNTPVEQRAFLLLLDEIDIHLHPAWQRRVLPLVQRLFPNAQIIASTHSPFVVGSLADGRIISLGLAGSEAKVTEEVSPQLGVSYSAVLRSIFGIESEFDVDTEDKLGQFHAARRRLLGGDESARGEVDRLGDELTSRSEELREIIALERAQLRRQLEQRRAAP